MASVPLPEVPEGIDFEDYIAAYLQAGGRYIEKNLINRDIDTILELDIISTEYDSTPLDKIKLIEIKSGGFGYEDTFKIRGWMHFLGISNGIMIAKKYSEKVNFEKMIEVANSLDINLLVIPNLVDTPTTLSPFLDPKKINPLDVSVWRYSYLTERRLIECLRNKTKFSSLKCHKVLKDYYSDVNNDIFFIENITERLTTLYSRFKKNPHISAKCGNELNGNNFEEDCTLLPRNIFNDTYNKCIFNEIQISTFIEYRSRLAILKNAVDMIICQKNGIEDKISNGKRITYYVGNTEKHVILMNSLPQSFYRALRVLANEKYFYKYPVFWQWFMWVFGGFILKDYEDQEYSLLSQKTGIPVEEIPNALNIYNILFPTSSNWFRDLPNTNIRQLTMFPVPFKGVGAHYRKLLYTSSKNFSDLKLTESQSLSYLIEWNNHFVEVLQYCKPNS